MTVIAFDLLRLALAPFSATPRGIDRVDLGYARHLFGGGTDLECIGVLPTPIGPRWFPRNHVFKYVRFIESAWDEAAGSAVDLGFEAVVKWLATGVKQDIRPSNPDSSGASLRRVASTFLNNPWSLGRSLRSLPERCVYLNIGQVGLGHPWSLSWLRRRSDVAAAFMIHDVIPLTHFELVTASNSALHDRIVTTALDYADALLVPSNAAKEAITHELERRRAAAPPTHAVHLPISDIFLRRGDVDLRLAQRTYYVVCGTIEKRKNHMLLLHVWRDLVEQFGERTPMLVMAGAIGWQSDDVTKFLQDNPGVARFATIATGISTNHLRDLMAQARAVLAPSLAEGFGLPPIEALSLGTPALLSDIPSHKEAAGEFGIFFGPHDTAGWRDAIARLTFDENFHQEVRARVATFRPVTWPQHMEQVLGILSRLT